VHFLDQGRRLDAHDGGGLFLVAAGPLQAGEQEFYFKAVEESLEGDGPGVVAECRVTERDRIHDVFQKLRGLRGGP
jgi:hypothetical protein